MLTDKLKDISPVMRSGSSYLAIVCIISLSGGRIDTTGKTVPEINPSDCIVCSRVETFQKVHQFVSKHYWEDFSNESLQVPLLYFSDTSCFLAFTDSALFKKPCIRFRCSNGIELFRYPERIDSVPFHMENRMNFSDKASPYYFNPVMFCSDVEKSRQVAPVQHTEEWIQLVMHEYFHGFQFNHKTMIRYLADSLTIGVDSLSSIYLKDPWFEEAIGKENKMLLKAIEGDSTIYYTNQFINLRSTRRQAFKQRYGYSITAAEDFWEKTEGTARYLEYYTAIAFREMKSDDTNCDTHFNHFKNYRTVDPDTAKWFVERTLIMPAYYYVTGFNMCRLMDKLAISYKNNFFGTMHISLFDKLCERNSSGTKVTAPVI